jgi:hypothetical protein
MKIFAAAMVTLLLALPAAGQDYTAQVLDERLAADDLPKEIAEKLSAKAIRVSRGTRTLCDVWLVEDLPIREDFKATGELLYPLTPGQLVGAIRLPRRGSDFRAQDIERGVYTLRYELQPVDGAHVGTSPTRDFLLMVAADQEKSAAVMDTKALAKLSAAAAQSSHPALLCLRPAAEVPETLPAMRHDERHDWRSVVFAASAKAGDKPARLVLELVVEGHAQE